MRLNVTTIGLVALLLGSATAARGDGSTPVTIVDSDEQTGTSNNAASSSVIEFPGPQFPTSLPGTNIFKSSEGARTISWSIVANTPGPVVTKVILYRLIGRELEEIATAVSSTTTAPAVTGGVPSDPQQTTSGLSVVSSVNSPAAVGGRSRTPTGLSARATPIPFALQADFSGSIRGSVTLDLAPFAAEPGGAVRNEFTFHDVWDKTICLALEWKDSQRNGKSYSRGFMVTNSDGSVSTLAGLSGILLANLREFNNTLDASSPVKNEEYSPLVQGTTTRLDTANPVPGTSLPTSTSGGTVEGSVGASTGLSTGAIAGIAVGAGAVGLAILGLIAFFLIRRRRSQHGGTHHPVAYSSDGPTNAGHVPRWDKELPLVASESPQSRFAPEGGHLHDHRSSVVGSHMHHDEDTGTGSYQPYSDREASVVRSPSPPANTRYAHLVEEGMSEDQIRQLEEEERQLDAAIEVAGRTSRAA